MKPVFSFVWNRLLNSNNAALIFYLFFKKEYLKLLLLLLLEQALMVQCLSLIISNQYIMLPTPFFIIIFHFLFEKLKITLITWAPSENVVAINEATLSSNKRLAIVDDKAAACYYIKKQCNNQKPQNTNTIIQQTNRFEFHCLTFTIQRCIRFDCTWHRWTESINSTTTCRITLHT